ncbi:MAG TPA: MarR family transcriptional regulator [Casimicrobiaceae bacterium]|jgi:DNA-binding MarR family transcriptional regulator|nr:MarR family transcriptional regulator [Casimicrobiaceae bacterium]
METTSVVLPALYSAKTFDPHTGLGRLLGQVKMELMDALDRELAPLDITSAQYVILVTLAEAPDSASGLCKGVSYDPGAMTRMIDRLERKGLVRRIRCPDDRRRINLELTPEGKAVYPRLIESVVTVLNRYLRGFSKDEIIQFEGFLKRMLVNG